MASAVVGSTVPNVQPRYLAIDLGAARLAAGVVDDAGTVLVRDRVATPARHVWPTLTRLVQRVLAASPGDDPAVACGVACVGPVDHEAGALSPVHVPSWIGFPLRRELEAVTGLPVAIDTSGRAAVRAERWCGAAVGRDDVVAVLLGDVVDAGIVAGGRLLHGRSGNVGQLGHLVVEPDGQRCVCGGAGCLDVYAGAAAIESETNRPLSRTPPALMERAGIMAGRAVASVAAMVDPSMVLIAGRVPATFGAPMLEALHRELETRSRLSHLSGLDVVDVTHTGTGPLIAAAAVARSLAAHSE